MSKKRKLAVIVPGIGYTCDRSLLYYASKTAQEKGYEVIRIRFSHLPDGAKDDPEVLQQCFAQALLQMENQLRKVDWTQWDRIVFIAKSIGTAVAGDYMTEREIDGKMILFTPLAETFQFVHGKAIAFHGTADPWADTEAVTDACEGLEIPLYITEGANHSLETGHVKEDLKTLRETMKTVRSFLKEKK